MTLTTTITCYDCDAEFDTRVEIDIDQVPTSRDPGRPCDRTAATRTYTATTCPNCNTEQPADLVLQAVNHQHWNWPKDADWRAS